MRLNIRPSRQDFYTFIHRSFRELNPKVRFLHNWHNELIAGKLDACARGEIRRLIINVPPRSLKSHAATVAFPAFILGYYPAPRSSAPVTGKIWLTNTRWTAEP